MCTVHLEETEIVLQSSERGGERKGGICVSKVHIFKEAGDGSGGSEEREELKSRSYMFYLMRCAAGSRRYFILARHIIAIHGERKANNASRSKVVFPLSTRSLLAFI